MILLVIVLPDVFSHNNNSNNAHYKAPMSRIDSEELVRAACRVVEGWVKGRLEIVSFERTFKGR